MRLVCSNLYNKVFSELENNFLNLIKECYYLSFLPPRYPAPHFCIYMDQELLLFCKVLAEWSVEYNDPVNNMSTMYILGRRLISTVAEN